MLEKWILFWWIFSYRYFAFAYVATKSSRSSGRLFQGIRENSLVLKAVSTSRVAIYDGAEWTSIQKFLPAAPSLSGGLSSNAGYMTVVTGTTEDAPQKRVMGIQVLSNGSKDSESTVSLDQDVHIYKDSMVSVPSDVTDQDAISTMMASLSGVYCGLPRLEGVGGGGESFVSGKVVVMGGSDYARFVAEALAALGANVAVVTTNDKLRFRNSDIDVMKPAVGELDIGFAAALGDFDALVDTMSDERRGDGFLSDDEDEDDMMTLSGGGVVSLLKSQHNCHRYVSTMTESQRIVRDSGVLFGPGKADKHISTTQNSISSKFTTQIIPPSDLADMVQTLLDKKILFSNNKNVRSWSLQEFWELASWPRDSSGSNVRYGLPVLDDIEADGMVSAPPLTNIDRNRQTQAYDEIEEEALPSNAQKNPFVMDITDVTGLQHEVLSSHRDCVMFMSASYCTTCRYMTPAFTRMARMTTEEKDNVFFAKANTAGKSGKELGRVLDVKAVPTFVMFRGGKRYGDPLSITKLPSKKLDLAVQYLTSGMEWDSTAFRDKNSD